MASNSTTREAERLEAAMAVRPPVIVWRLDPVRRVQVGWIVDDPYMTGGANGEKTHCKRDHEFTPENTINTPSGRQCRICKNEATSDWQARHPRVLRPEQRERANELERLRRRQRKELAAMEDEAREVADRFERHRADNTPLMNAARTSI